MWMKLQEGKNQEASILHIAVINSNVIAERLVMDAITKAA